MLITRTGASNTLTASPPVLLLHALGQEGHSHSHCRFQDRICALYMLGQGSVTVKQSDIHAKGGGGDTIKSDLH